MVMATNGTLLDIELLPIFPPPPGQVSNFIDPDDQMTATVSIHVVCLAFLTVFVVMRIYTRRYIIGKLRLDDCMTPLVDHMEIADAVRLLHIVICMFDQIIAWV